MSAAAKAGPASPATEKTGPGNTGPGNTAPDQAEFARLTDPFRSELLAHCYRMLGSVHDAEDQVQETLLRAWKSYGDFEGRASLRTWLHRIATNACLRALENRSRRPLPSGLAAPGEDVHAPLAATGQDIPWLQPIPDAMVATGPDDPAVIVGSRMSLRLAMIAALQYLPARQRAALILRDVLGWRAAEAADLLGSSTTAVNSMLQRARAQLKELTLAQDEIREPAEPQRRALLDRYAAAFENADIRALTGLLREDATLEMPPQPAWFAGRDQVGAFLAARVLRRPGDFTLLPSAANGQPAFVTYLREPGGRHLAHGVQVLTLDGPAITGIVSFNDPWLVEVFGMPPELIVPAGGPGR